MTRWKVVGAGALLVAGALAAAPTVRAWWGGQREGRGDRFEFFSDREGGQIGASVRDVEQADLDKARLTAQAGAVVEDVRAGSPAASAGLKAGDIFLEFDGERVRSARQLIRLVRETPVGRTVKAAVQREGTRVDLEIIPGERSEMSWGGPRFREPLVRLDELGDLHDLRDLDIDISVGGRGRLGVTVQELTPELAQYFGVKNGVLVSSVRDPDTPAAKAGLKAGDVITAVNQRTVTDRRDLIRALDEVQNGVEATLAVVRDKKPLTLKAVMSDSGAGAGRRARSARAI